MRYRWAVLAAGTAAQASLSALFVGLPVLAPALRDEFDLTLSQVGLALASLWVGPILTLLGWGLLADRLGERAVLGTGLAVCGALTGAAGWASDFTILVALLFLASATGASVNAASGRAVLTWFPATGRGTAMAIRQTAVPVGAAVAAVALPPIADAGGVPAVFAALAVTCLAAAAAVAAFIREPPDRPARSARPAARAREVLADRRLQRLSLAGLLLVVPQFLGSVFLVEVLHGGAGLSLPVAGALLGLTQVLGAVGRLVNGAWSDRVRSRLGPLRIVAIAVAAGFAMAAVLRPGPAALLAAVLVPAAALAISWNGLVFTAAGELAPAGRAATAMAMSNTANYMAAAVAPALGGLVADLAGWSAMFTMGAIAALGALFALRHLAEPAAKSVAG
jgi:MFS family permease